MLKLPYTALPLLLISLAALASGANDTKQIDDRISLNSSERTSLTRDLPWAISDAQKYFLLSGAFSRQDIVMIQNLRSLSKTEGVLIRFSEKGITLFDGMNLAALTLAELRILAITKNDELPHDPPLPSPILTELEREHLNQSLSSVNSSEMKTEVLEAARRRRDRVLLNIKKNNATIEVVVDRVMPYRLVVSRDGKLSVLEHSRYRVVQLLPALKIAHAVCGEAYAASVE